MSSFDLNAIPAELRERNQWLLWKHEKRNGDTTKIPYQPSGAPAKSNDRGTWRSFEEVVDKLRSTSQFSGIGFVFSDSDTLLGVDLDDCTDDSGALTDEAQAIVKLLGTYAEWSPSGNGIHIIGEASKPGDRCRTGDIPGMKELEMYDSGRFFTMTGWTIGNAPDAVHDCSEGLVSLYERAFDARSGKGSSNRTHSAPAESHLTDQEVIEKARAASNGDKFKALWEGNISAYGDDHSRADQALVNLLAYWTGGDRAQIDRLFRQSGLCREKWTGRPDYRRRTIDTALDGRTDFYEPTRNGRAETSSSNDPWDDVRSAYNENKSQGRYQAARQIIDELNVATDRKTDQLHVWDSSEAVYKDDGEQTIRTRLVRELKATFSQHEANEILGIIRPQTYRSTFGADGYIPVANGDLKLDMSSYDVTLENTTPVRGFRTRSPAAWNPSAEAPTFQEYLKDVVPLGTDRKTLQEYVGYALMYWALPYHKALFLVGPQASGKSTFLNVVHELLGKTTQLSPQQLVDGRFGAVELEDSWANIAGDIPSVLLKNVGKFKEITAGDRIHVERKFEQGYPIEPTAKHLYSANQLPEIKIDDNAFFRRVLIAAFPDTVERSERDPHLDRKLIQELDGILQWAVEGLTRLLENNGFTGDLPPSETRRMWDEHASSIGQFKIRHLEVTGNHDHAEAKQDVYKAYSKFCQQQGLSMESQKQLTSVLKRDPKIGQAKRTPIGYDRQVRCYIGVQLPDSDDQTPF